MAPCAKNMIDTAAASKWHQNLCRRHREEMTPIGSELSRMQAACVLYATAADVNLGIKYIRKKEQTGKVCYYALRLMLLLLHRSTFLEAPFEKKSLPVVARKVFPLSVATSHDNPAARPKKRWYLPYGLPRGP